MIARVLIARAGNNDAATADPASVVWRMQGHRHFRPLRKRHGTPKLYAVLVEDDRVRRERKASLPRFDGHSLQGASTNSSSRTHTAPSGYHAWQHRQIRLS